MRSRPFVTNLIRTALALAALLAGGQVQALPQPEPPPRAADATALPLAALAARLAVGDVVFIRVTARPFREVADATGSWTNHVGVVVDTGGAEPLVAESTFPLSRRTPLSDFVARSEGGRVAVRRLTSPLSAEQAQRLREAADRRMGVFYDTGFDLQSQRQFCSRFVREVLAEATGVTLGEVETFAHLLARRPDANLGFWRAWYFGRIPWQRQTVTPASLLLSRELVPVHDGEVDAGAAASDPTLMASR